MRVRTRYRRRFDLKAVDQSGYVDLASANDQSVIPADIALSEERFNMIDNPNSVGYRPRDQFEAAQAAKVITGYKAPEGEKQE